MRNRLFTICFAVLLAAVQLAGQEPKKAEWHAGPGKPVPGVRGFNVLFENDQLIVNPPQPYPGAGDPSFVGPEPEGSVIEDQGLGWRSKHGVSASLGPS